ncbi:hypothetical protein G6F35_017333 [Rhizopus arrhizus]|nr:hypothetical protein G6F35_017333 [Rhizopus arrhizus]
MAPISDRVGSRVEAEAFCPVFKVAAVMVAGAWVQPSRAWIHGGGVKHIQGQADHDGAQQALLHPQEPRIAPDPAADTRRAEREAAAIGQAQHLHRDAQHQHLDPHGPVVRRGELRQEGDHEQQHLRVQQIRHEALPEGVAGVARAGAQQELKSDV